MRDSRREERGRRWRLCFFENKARCENPLVFFFLGIAAAHSFDRSIGFAEGQSIFE